ncbi:hypothetical protein AB4298_13685 [Shewanella sp. 10N.261.52.F9]|uniref:hypothetical protein n=1 Tax=Shewanella TaxID=22 RepID=UPI00200C97B6|nr:hypothetical protein [Shewanella marinintestina]
MAVLAMGAGLILLGLAFMGLPKLNNTLKQHDRAQWEVLARQRGRLTLPFERMSLFAWTLNRGFENSENIDIQYAGLIAYKHATRVKYLILLGVSLVIIGSVMFLVKG